MHIFFVYILYICVLRSSQTTSTFCKPTSILNCETMIVFQHICDKLQHDTSLQFWISSNDLVTSSHNIRGTFH